MVENQFSCAQLSDILADNENYLNEDSSPIYTPLTPRINRQFYMTYSNSPSSPIIINE